MRISDWSADVCSSDRRAGEHAHLPVEGGHAAEGLRMILARAFLLDQAETVLLLGHERQWREGRQRFRQHDRPRAGAAATVRSEEHTSELQSLMRISYAVFCLKKKKLYKYQYIITHLNTRICK